MRLRKDTNQVNSKDVDFIAKVSDALAHPARIKMFRYIIKNNMQNKKICNRDIYLHFDLAQATVSQHIKNLVQSGLVEVNKSGKNSYYFANMGLLMKYVDKTKKFAMEFTENRR